MPAAPRSTPSTVAAAASSRWMNDDTSLHPRRSGTAACAPDHVPCDNGLELTANALREWCRLSLAATSYIEAGSPSKNPYVESFGSRIRDELLSQELVETLAEAQSSSRTGGSTNTNPPTRRLA